MNYVVWGATESAKHHYNTILREHTIVALVDNDSQKWGKKVCGIYVISPEKLKDIYFDKIAIISLSAMDSIRQQILDIGIPEFKIDLSLIEVMVRARINFVRDFSKVVSLYSLEGNVAEAGVFQGEFAKNINLFFKDKKLYLFDTFEGFDERDIKCEIENNYSKSMAGHLSITSEELVIEKMTYPQNCILKKGYFPDSAFDVIDKFCFVSLDMDLYKPTLAGLDFFWDKMVKGGVILVHDYFSEGYYGVNDAVDEFAKMKDIIPMPVGDGISVAFVKG